MKIRAIRGVRQPSCRFLVPRPTRKSPEREPGSRTPDGYQAPARPEEWTSRRLPAEDSRTPKLDAYSTHAAKRNHLFGPGIARRGLSGSRSRLLHLHRGRFSCRIENDNPRCRFLPLRRLTTPSRRGIAQPKPAEVRIFLSLCSVE